MKKENYGGEKGVQENVKLVWKDISGKPDRERERRSWTDERAGGVISVTLSTHKCSRVVLT